MNAEIYKSKASLDSKSIIDFSWMNMQRGIAVLAITFYHWLYFLPWKKSSYLLDIIVGTIQVISGTYYHLFFVISGYGLTISYFESRTKSWQTWAKRRFLRIIIPYWIVVTLSFVLIKVISYFLPLFFNNTYPWSTLLTYLLFLQNLNDQSNNYFNIVLWFIPVILCMYMLFPVLILILRRYGIVFFSIISAFITYSSIALSLCIGYPVDRGHAIFSYYLIEFSFGMIWAYIVIFDKTNIIHALKGYNLIFIGIILYLVSWMILTFLIYGEYYHHIFTAAGLFFVTLYICQLIVKIAPNITKHLNYVSNLSYLMYLIHGFIILYILKPMIGNFINTYIPGTIMIILACLFCLITFQLAKLITPIIDDLTSKL